MMIVIQRTRLRYYTFHGDSDGVVPYGGEPGMESIDDILSYWIGENNCPTEAYFEELPDISTGDGTVEFYSYLSGDECSRVDHYKVLGGGHDWFGAFGNMDINASEIIWDFLSEHNINGWTGCTTLGDIELDTQSEFQVYPNPSESDFTIVSSSIGESYTIVDAKGVVLKRGTIQSVSQKLDVSNLPANIYFLNIGEDHIRLIKK